MKRLNIYIMHSNKFDYNNLIYKNIVQSDLYIKHNIILPLSKENEEKYVKDLINNADVIVSFLNNDSFGLSLELKWLLKANKPVLYLSLSNNINKKYLKRIKEVKVIKPSDIVNVINDFVKIFEEEKDNDLTVLGNLN